MTRWRRWRGLPIVLALAGAVLSAVLVLSHVTIQTDMADFLPRGRTPGSRLMLEQLRSGSATSLIMLGVEGAPTATLAGISRSMNAALTGSRQFVFVENGDTSLLGSDTGQLLFRYRYILAPRITAGTFSGTALRTNLATLLHGLESSAAPLVSQFGLADPPGAFLALLRQWSGASPVRSIDGVWFAPGGKRTLIVARTRAGGTDLGGQERAAAAIRAAFAAAHPPPGVRLLVAGPGVFARQAAETMRADVTMLSITSTLLLAALLFWRFRSVSVLLLVAVPVTLGIAVAALAVQILFGFVHGVAIGFGITMLGITLDYPVLLVGHRKFGEPASGTLQRIGQAFRLAVFSAAMGLTGLVFSGVPGLSQLGCFAVVGLLTAAAVTRWVLPHLIVAANLAPVFDGNPARLLGIERWRAWRGWAAGLSLAAIAGLVAAGGPRWETSLAALSPVPQRDLALDATLRRDLGAPDTVQVGLVQGPSDQAVLQQQEKLAPAIDALTARKVLAGADYAARYLPSVASQLARQAVLPDAKTLSASMAEAQAGTPFRPDAFKAFIDAVTTSRTLPPLSPANVSEALFRARLDPLLFCREHTCYGLITPRELTDPTAFIASLRAGGAHFVDVAAEMDELVAGYTRTAWHWFAIGCAGALIVIVAGLRSWRRALAVTGAIAAALLVTVTILTALRMRLSLFNIVSLQLVAGVGLDYALFFARRQLDLEERARTLRTLLTCNAMTVLTFGVLALCRTPLLRQIGITVALGAILALAFAFLFVGERQPDSRKEHA